MCDAGQRVYEGRGPAAVAELVLRPAQQVEDANPVLDVAAQRVGPPVRLEVPGEVARESEAPGQVRGGRDVEPIEGLIPPDEDDDRRQRGGLSGLVVCPEQRVPAEELGARFVVRLGRRDRRAAGDEKDCQR